MKLMAMLLFTPLLAGCSLSSALSPSDPFTVRIVAQSTTYLAARSAKVDRAAATEMIGYLKTIEEVLPSALPPDFSEARMTATRRTTGDTRFFLLKVIDLTEHYASDYLREKGDRADLLALRAVMEAVIAGAAEGLASVS